MKRTASIRILILILIWVGCTPFLSLRDESLSQWAEDPPKRTESFIRESRSVDLWVDWNSLNVKTLFIPTGQLWEDYLGSDPQGIGHPDNIMFKRDWFNGFVVRDSLGPRSLYGLDSIPTLNGYLHVRSSDNDLWIEGCKVERVIRLNDAFVYLIDFKPEQFQIHQVSTK